MKLHSIFTRGVMAVTLTSVVAHYAAAQYVPQGQTAYNPYAQARQQYPAQRARVPQQPKQAAGYYQAAKPQAFVPNQQYAPTGRYAPLNGQLAVGQLNQGPQTVAPGVVPQQVGQPIGRYAMAAQSATLPATQMPATQLPAPQEQVMQPAANTNQFNAGPAMTGPASTGQPIPPAATAPATQNPAAVTAYANVPAGTVSHHAAQPPATNWEGYTGANCADQCATGHCATGYGASGSCAMGACGTGYGPYGGATCYEAPAQYGASDYNCYDGRPRRQWFAGLYGLYMSRDNPGTATSAVLVDGAPAGNYYPQPGTDVFFITSAADVDFQGGAEVRFGSTLGAANGCATHQPFAWEIGYWALSEDENFAEITDTFGGTTRLYGMINYAGLEYDRDGAGATYGYRPVNDYYDYQVPIDSTSTNDVRVVAVRVRHLFEAQNLELNFWRFGTPTPSGGGGGAGLGNGLLARRHGGAYGPGAACGAAGCGTGAYACDSSGYVAGCHDTCGCDAYGCQPARPGRMFLINGLAGVRYFKMDETFRNSVFFARDDGLGGVAPPDVLYPGFMPTTGAGADQVLFHDVEIDNQLLGFQLGCSMNCLIGCKWTLFCDSNFGIYGNDIDSYQRVFSPGGGVVRFVGTGGDAAIRTSKTDVAFLGEARLGVAYQVSPRWRLTGAYRVIGISGVALAVEQVTTPVNEAAWSSIDSNDSLVIHGLQAGVECKF